MKMKWLGTRRTLLVLIVTALTAACSAYNANPFGGYGRHDNFWYALQSGFRLHYSASNPRVQTQVNWHLQHQKVLYNVANRASPYLYYIYQQVRRRHLPTEIALLPIVESGYNPFASSSAGAAGLWQLMPRTASELGIKQNWWYDGRRDIVASTEVALDYLVWLHQHYHGDWLLAFAAYNAGPGTVDAAIAHNRAHHIWRTDYWHLSTLPTETQIYVPRLLALALVIERMDRYRLKMPSVKNNPYLKKVELDSPIDLAQVAKLANISLEEVRHLNPGYNRWATGSSGHYTLILPQHSVKYFKEQLATLPKAQRISWNYHVVAPGDNLRKIAYKTRTAIDLLREINHLRNDRVHTGQTLLLPRQLAESQRRPLFSRRPIAVVPHISGQGTRTWYTVRIGESLSEVSRVFNVNVSQLKSWNHLGSDHIRPGQRLLILVAKPTATHGKRWFATTKRVPAKQSIATKKPIITSAHRHYAVKSGDTLFKISRQFGTSVNALIQVNRLKSPNIHQGQTLSIPATV